MKRGEKRWGMDKAVGLINLMQELNKDVCRYRTNGVNGFLFEEKVFCRYWAESASKLG
jgi:hypothetical protein